MRPRRDGARPSGSGSGEPGGSMAFGTRGWVLTGVLLAAAVLADVALGRSLPGLDAVYGFTGCVAIVVASKWLGKYWLQRAEAYYGEAEDA